MNFREYNPEDLLGPFNETEKKYAPKSIYLAGDAGLLKNTVRVAIVGSRKASNDGLKRTSKLTRILVERGVVVISGLAEGIDTIAHQTAISSGGRTIAVLGTPLDKVYPKMNRQLQDLISKDHLAVSQFPPGTEISRRNFPMRNRTMALLCDLSVIIEAGETSGSHSQGWETLRLGRPLFLMRSVAEDRSLNWPKKMLDYGAQVLADESLDCFFEQIPPTEQVLESMIAF